MVERDQYGYLLKIVSNFPYHPWWRLTSLLAEGLRDEKRNRIVSSVGIYTPKFGLGSLENPKMIGSGEVHAGILNPPVRRTGNLGSYKRGFPEILVKVIGPVP